MIKKQPTTNYYATAIEPYILLPAICVQSGRQQFRKEFIKSYPFFIYMLRNSVPQVTPCEELLCMLIYLKQTTDNISAILGINRKSVNQSRYRLRLKMNMPKHLSLEDFIHQLTDGQK